MHTSLIHLLHAAKPLTLDYRALNVFFRLGMFLNGRTPFREIRRFAPEPLIEPPTTLSREAIIDGYIDLFRESIRRRIRAHSVLALSGGCDSRHILLELHSQQCLPTYALTVALDDRPSEVLIASELARRTGVRHLINKPCPSSCIEDELYKNQACGFTTLEHAWFASTARQRDSLPLWDGIAGDVLSAGLFLEEWSLRLFAENRLDELADRLVSHHRVPYFRDQSLFPRAEAVSEVRTELEKHIIAPNPVGSFYFWNRTRMSIASSAFGLTAPSGQETLAPYLDKDLYAFLASIPARMLLDHTLHQDTVFKAYPAFANVPLFTNKAKVNSWVLKRKTLHLLRYLAISKQPRLEQVLMLLRAFRALLFRRHHQDIEWLLPVAVYCTQIQHYATMDASK